jgi:hypothetical protein
MPMSPPVSPSFRLRPQRRRFNTTLLGLALGLLSGPAARAQGPGRPIDKLGIFSLLGDGLQITLPGVITDSRLDRNLRETLPAKDIGFDQAALRAVTEFMRAQRPAARLEMYRATTPLSLADQRAVAEGATRAELPAWIIEAIERAKLSHILLITRHRGDASFMVQDGYSVGRGAVEGIGFYLDSDTEVKNSETGLNSQGFLGAYTMMRLQLMEVATGNIIGSQDIRASQMYAGRRDTEAANVWNALTPTEKVQALRDLIERNLARVLPQVMARA